MWNINKRDVWILRIRQIFRQCVRKTQESPVMGISKMGFSNLDKGMTGNNPKILVKSRGRYIAMQRSISSAFGVITDYSERPGTGNVLV